MAKTQRRTAELRSEPRNCQHADRLADSTQKALTTRPRANSNRPLSHRRGRGQAERVACDELLA